jgi:serine/threonine-protein kinase
MGVVLKARDVDLGRDVAVKVLRGRYSDRPEMVNRFIEEAQIGGQLQHPGIVPVYELGRFPDSRLYIAMKLVKGRTLASLLAARKDAADDRPRLLSIFEHVCQTMAYAHSCGVIHRDLKPSNVMVGSFGEVQVMDWGLAKVVDQGGVAVEERGRRTRDDSGVIRIVRTGSSPDESRAGSVLGTPAYMAPEQARGQFDTLDERADVFGLGAILCEILTGRPPYTGSSSDEHYSKANRGDLAECLARLDACDAERELIDLARACLAAAPKDRPRDAEVVAARLTAHLAGMQERLKAAGLAQAQAEARAVEERKRRTLAVGLAAALVAVAALGVGGLTWVARDRAARVEALTREVAEATRSASLLLDRARAAPKGELALWSEATQAAERARYLLGRGEVHPDLSRRVQELFATVARERGLAEAEVKDRRMVDRLAAIHADIGVHFDFNRADADYAAAFREYGVDVDALDPAVAGARLGTTPVAQDLANALDQWTFIRRHRPVVGAVGGRRRGDPDGARRLVAIAKATDSDPWRNRLRDTLSETATDRDRAVEALRRLAATADPEHLPEASVTRLAWELANRGDRGLAIDLLRRTQRVHPDDFWVNRDFALMLAAEGRYEEAVRFYSVALAIRPQSKLALRGLGRALRAAGRTEEAAMYLGAPNPKSGPPEGAR